MNAIALQPEYADWPKLILTAIGCQCPVCGREWVLHGGGQGFVKVGARKHVGACFERKLAANGLEMGNWSDEKQAHILVPLGHYQSLKDQENTPTKSKIADDGNWPWPVKAEQK